MAMITVPEDDAPPFRAAAPETGSGPEIRLRIFDRIEPGFGVVPILANEPFVFRTGEVAVYREERALDFAPGLYCLERQKPVALSPHPDSRKVVDRRVVYIRASSRGTEPNNWEYLELDTRVRTH